MNNQLNLMTNILEALEVRKFIEAIERVITFLMNQGNLHVSTAIEIFDKKIVLFVAETNVGYGGYVPGYEVFILKPEGIPFTKPTDITVMSIDTIEKVSPQDDIRFQRVVITLPKKGKTAREILCLAGEVVALFFGEDGDMLDVRKWDRLQPVTERKYTLKPLE